MGLTLRPEPYLARTLAAAAAALPITAFNADGYSATYPSPPAGPALSTPLTGMMGKGYVSGVLTDINLGSVYKLTYRRRTLYGTSQASDGSLTADIVTAASWICSNFTASGVTNNSTLVSPKPIGCWGMFDRDVVGNSITARWKLYHWAAKNQKQVESTELRATDG